MEQCYIFISTTIIFVCKETCRFVFKRFCDNITSEHEPVIVETHVHLPRDPCIIEYVYSFKHRKFRVLLNCNVTNFANFAEELLRTPVPLVPNRAIMTPSESVDIQRFNEFLGPTCDFHRSISGTVVRPSVIISTITDDDDERTSYPIMDTRGIVHCARQCLADSSTLWVRDCLPRRGDPFLCCNEQDERTTFPHGGR